jgi:hypothetical protein
VPIEALERIEPGSGIGVGVCLRIIKIHGDKGFNLHTRFVRIDGDVIIPMCSQMSLRDSS